MDQRTNPRTNLQGQTVSMEGKPGSLPRRLFGDVRFCSPTSESRVGLRDMVAMAMIPKYTVIQAVLTKLPPSRITEPQQNQQGPDARRKYALL